MMVACQLKVERGPELRGDNPNVGVWDILLMFRAAELEDK